MSIRDGLMAKPGSGTPLAAFDKSNSAAMGAELLVRLRMVRIVWLRFKGFFTAIGSMIPLAAIKEPPTDGSELNSKCALRNARPGTPSVGTSNTPESAG